MMAAPTFPRQLTSHLAGPGALPLAIAVGDEPGAGGAHQRYVISGFNAGRNPSSGRAHAEYLRAQQGSNNPEIALHYQSVLNAQDTLTVLFQNGNPAVVGVNGVTIEALLAVAIDRLQGFQSGQFADEHNAAALVYLRSAQEVLHQRTRERLQKVAD